jgi:MFS superfamily sulfate permease-like transporter
VPGLAVHRFGANLYYANANRFADRVRALSLGGTGDPPRWICVDAEAIGDIDYSAPRRCGRRATSWRRAGCGWCCRGQSTGAS